MNQEIFIKTKNEIAIMREGGKIAARILNLISKAAKPGITPIELDQLADKEIRKSGARASFKNFNGYPAATCISINSQIVHGIPNNRRLKEGDIVGIDLGVYYNGFHNDTATTIGIGKISPEAHRLIEVTKKALENGIGKVKAGVHLGDVQAAIQNTIEKAGFGVIRDLTGHGVGRDLQESPPIPNFGQAGNGLILKEGMTLAIEPMVSLGDWHIRVLDDGWTVETSDHSLAAHFEHTIVVKEDSAEVLTKIF